MLRLLAIFLLLVMIPAAAWSVESGDAKTYAECTEQARQHPDDAFETASSWRDHGGGLPAEHCLALALNGLQEYQQSAELLERMATEMVREPIAMRADTLSQAAEAWSEAGKPDNAEAALTEAMKLVPGNPDYMVSRAAVRAQRKDYWGAVADLNQVITLGGPRGDALAYRAAAWRFLGDVKQAGIDAEAAVKASPGLADAWLERANVRRQTGDTNGARQDWLQVLRLSPDSAAGDAARDNLEKLDIHPDGIEATEPAR